MLARATSSDESPTPGYMYGEIAKMTLASFDACKQIEDYLLKRCGNKNANVKNKALLIIKHVASSGRPEFRRNLLRQCVCCVRTETVSARAHTQHPPLLP